MVRRRHLQLQRQGVEDEGRAEKVCYCLYVEGFDERLAAVKCLQVVMEGELHLAVRGHRWYELRAGQGRNVHAHRLAVHDARRSFHAELVGVRLGKVYGQRGRDARC